MENGIILLTQIIFSLLFLTVIARLAREWLYASIVVNILLIVMFGAKTISVFGFATNSGNVFYASLVFAIYLLIEHHGRESATKVLPLAMTFSFFAILMSELLISTLGTAETRTYDSALHTVFQYATRLILASLTALFVSQIINIRLYVYLLQKMKGKMLWFRAISSSTVTQLVDSAIFFPLAFYGILSKPLVIESMITGFVLKSVIGILSVPFLYLSLKLKKEGT